MGQNKIYKIYKICQSTYHQTKSLDLLCTLWRSLELQANHSRCFGEPDLWLYPCQLKRDLTRSHSRLDLHRSSLIVLAICRPNAS